jgi:hypothetical protein
MGADPKPIGDLFVSEPGEKKIQRLTLARGQSCLRIVVQTPSDSLEEGAALEVEEVQQVAILFVEGTVVLFAVEADSLNRREPSQAPS